MQCFCVQRSSLARLPELRRLLLDDHLGELLVVDHAVAVDVHLPDDLLDVLEGDGLAHVDHDALQLVGADVTAIVWTNHE